ncbi:hypothetical protein ACP70R_032765 [Stipagrostis hirtigluma subsp. patula]
MHRGQPPPPPPPESPGELLLLIRPIRLRGRPPLLLSVHASPAARRSCSAGAWGAQEEKAAEGLGLTGGEGRRGARPTRGEGRRGAHHGAWSWTQSASCRAG